MKELFDVTVVVAGVDREGECEFAYTRIYRFDIEAENADAIAEAIAEHLEPLDAQYL